MREYSHSGKEGRQESKMKQRCGEEREGILERRKGRVTQRHEYKSEAK